MIGDDSGVSNSDVCGDNSCKSEDGDIGDSDDSGPGNSGDSIGDSDTGNIHR